MPPASTNALFFGMDLHALARDFKIAWQGMKAWPVFSWFAPTADVRLHLPSGAQLVSSGVNGPVAQDTQRSRTAKHQAIVLSEDVLIRRSLRLPPLRPAELNAAVAMDVKAVSPFSPDESLWIYHTGPEVDGMRPVDVAITSRKLVGNYTQPLGAWAPTAEIWISRQDGGGFMAVPGYGQGTRAQGARAWRWLVAAAVLLALLLLAAIATTPTLQLYLRAQHAASAWAQLQPKVTPLIAEREKMLRYAEQLQRLEKIHGQPVLTLDVLKLLTEALPDDTSLTTLRIQGSKLTMGGQTSNTAALMKHLGSVAGLKDIKSPVPAVKPLGATREIFTIEALMTKAEPQIP
jgi:general secretion pathway protein L